MALFNIEYFYSSPTPAFTFPYGLTPSHAPASKEFQLIHFSSSFAIIGPAECFEGG